MPKDHTGKRFTRLIVLERISAIDNKGTLYRCKCDCGTEILVPGKRLVTGNTKSCGCLMREAVSKMRAKNYEGVRFGRLVAVERIRTPNMAIAYKCQCDCGNSVVVPTGRLQSKNTKSCGCLNIEKMAQRNHDPALIQKRITTCSDCTSIKHWKTGDIVITKGSWERKVVEYLNHHQIDFQWQIPFFLSDGRTYIIDLLLYNDNKYVEIKGWWRDDAKSKWDLFCIDNPLLIKEIWDKKILQNMSIL